jgi:glycosyltransferase involved in cell wall biosynthesis
MSGNEPPLVLVSGYPPSTAFGGGIVLRRLLERYPEDRLTVVTARHVAETLATRPDKGGLLPARHLFVGHWHSPVRGLRRLARSANALRIPHMAWLIRRALGRGSVILAVPWGGELGSELFAAAYLAHRLSGRPLVVYEMDEWKASLGTASGRVASALERVFHGALLRSAGIVWAMSEPMATAFADRFGVAARVLPHCVDLAPYAAVPRHATPDRGPLDVVFIGSINAAQADAVRGVALAIDRLPADARFILYTDQGAEELGRLGIAGPRLSIRPFVPSTELPAILRAADVLVVALSFEPALRTVVTTSFPTKTIDYLAAGVPILVHAPPDAAVSVRARAQGWGIVADDRDPARVGEILQRLATDGALRQDLARAALATVADHHNLDTRRAEFLGGLKAVAS